MMAWIKVQGSIILLAGQFDDLRLLGGIDLEVFCGTEYWQNDTTS